MPAHVCTASHSIFEGLRIPERTGSGQASCARPLHLSCCSEDSAAFHPVWGMSLQLVRPRLEPPRPAASPPAEAGDRRDGQEALGVEGGGWLLPVLQVRSSPYGAKGKVGWEGGCPYVSTFLSWQVRQDPNPPFLCVNLSKEMVAYRGLEGLSTFPRS